jgi:hypothetical protein
LGLCPNFFLKAGRRPARKMMSGCQQPAAAIPDLGLCCENIKNSVNSTLFRELGVTVYIDVFLTVQRCLLQAEIIVLYVHRYLPYPLSYCELEEMMHKHRILKPH